MNPPIDHNLGAVVAIDGPAASGKTTLGKTIASRLGLTFIDSGMMYRWIALDGIQKGTEITDDALARIADGLCDRILLAKGRGESLFAEAITATLLRPEVTRATMVVARIQSARDIVTATLREISRQLALVVSGRDIGTTVFPGATLKLFLEASLEVRARRRLVDEFARGRQTTLEQVSAELSARDFEDIRRPTGRLVRTPDYIIIDTSKLSPEDVASLAIGLLPHKVMG